MEQKKDAKIRRLEAALAKSEKDWGSEHNNTGVALFRLGLAYAAKDKYGMAMQYFRQALAVFEKCFPDGETNTAEVYRAMGKSYRCMEKTEQATDCLVKAWLMMRKHAGAKHRATANCSIDLADLYLELGELDRAWDFCAEATSVYESLPKCDREELAEAYLLSGQILYEQTLYRKSVDYQQKALEIFLQCRGESDPCTASAYYALGLCHEKLHEPLKAIDCMRHAARADDWDAQDWLTEIGQTWE